jgi:hypothetical protein
MKIVPIPHGSVKAGVSAPATPFKKVMDGATPKIPQALKTPLLPALKTQALVKAGAPVKAAVPAARAAQAPRPTANVKRHEAVAASMSRAREHVNRTAQNLSDLRTHHNEVAQGGQHARLVDLICQELRAEFGGDMKVAANSDKPMPFATAGNNNVVPISSAQAAQAGAAPAAAIVADANVKAASAVELIEKIETFMKSSRPALAITLQGSLGARVEIERLGPKEVAVRVVGKNGPPSAEDIGRIRDEIRARGLKVGALSVA